MTAINHAPVPHKASGLQDFVPFHKLETAQERLDQVEALTGVDMTAARPQNLASKDVEKNIEVFGGEVSFPVGWIGPLEIRGQHADGRYIVPFGTTEGALVASTSRGVKILNASGGVETVGEYNGMTRAPLFEFPNLSKAQEFKESLQDPELFAKMKEVAEANSNHTELLDVKAFRNGKHVVVRFRYDTGEAMGMNMSTFGTEQASEFLMNYFPGCDILTLSSNACVDKKPNAMNVIDGRGFHVSAAATIPRSLLEEEYDTTPEKLAKLVFLKDYVGGGAIAMATSFNAHMANPIAAVFAATGQDMAHVTESAQGSTVALAEADGMYISVTLPSVIMGTIGGGTGLPAQRAYMDAMLTDIGNPGEEIVGRRTMVAAEILGGAVLAAELNLHLALANHELASGHRQHARSNIS